MTAERWGKIVIVMIFQLVIDIWTQRNKDGHQLTEKNESEFSRQRILDMIQSLQESAPAVRFCDRDFVYCSMDTLNQYSLGNLLSWYKSACSIVKAQQRYENRQQSIRDIFPPRQLQHIELRTPSERFPDPNPTCIPVL